MVQLQHIFVAGIRFDTEVEYRVLRKQGYGYGKLPVKPPRNLVTAEFDGSLFSAIQSVSLVCERAFSEVQRQIQTLGLTSLASLAGSAFLQIDGIRIELQAIPCNDAKGIGATLLQAINEGDACMAQLAFSKGNRWSTVVGVEGLPDGQATSLLLLDSRADEPWAFGYNARLGLAQSAQASTRTRPECKLRFRTIAGDIHPASVMGLIRVRRVAKA